MSSLINSEFLISERSLMTPLFVGAGEIRKTNSWVFVVCCWFWFSLGFFKAFFPLFVDSKDHGWLQRDKVRVMVTVLVVSMLSLS